jgi:hypothetical protein
VSGPTRSRSVDEMVLIVNVIDRFASGAGITEAGNLLGARPICTAGAAAVGAAAACPAWAAGAALITEGPVTADVARASVATGTAGAASAIDAGDTKAAGGAPDSSTGTADSAIRARLDVLTAGGFIARRPGCVRELPVCSTGRLGHSDSCVGGSLSSVDGCRSCVDRRRSCVGESLVLGSFLPRVRGCASGRINCRGGALRVRRNCGRSSYRRRGACGLVIPAVASVYLLLQPVLQRGERRI